MTSSSAAPDSQTPGTIGGRQGRLRGEIPLWESILWGACMVLVVLAVWTFITWGERSEERLISATKLPSPAETFSQFETLWFEHALTRNTWASVSRVAKGFSLAVVLGVPLGVMCGCFPRVGAWFAPALIFGRNIPMAAVIPLAFLLFGIGETYRIMFIFIATVAFVVSDSAQAIQDIPQKYVDTAYTLGARRYQVIFKVLVPLSLPSILNSLRLLFGLAFGYIMLAELVRAGGESLGLGGLISMLERRSRYERIYMVLIVIPPVAFVIDRILYWCQVELLPYRYGSYGLLARGLAQLRAGWEWLRGLVFRPPTVAEAIGAGDSSSTTTAEPGR